MIQYPEIWIEGDELTLSCWLDLPWRLVSSHVAILLFVIVESSTSGV